MIRKSFVLIVLLLSIAFVQADYKSLLSPELLEEAGLKTVWEAGIALNFNEKVSRMWDIGDSIYILSDKNYLTCLDKSTGELRFSKLLAEQGLPVFAPELSEGVLTFVAGNKIIDIDPKLGTEIGRYDPGFTAVSSAVRSSDMLFMVSSAKMIFAVRSDDKLPRYRVSADNGSAITSLAACNGTVIFATEKGNIACFGIADRRKHWQHDVAGAITAPLVVDDGSVYVSSKDTNIYRISVLDGTVQWLFRSGASAFDSVRPGEKVIYQFIKHKGFYCIDKKTGQKLWLVPDGLDILTEADDKAYVYTSNRTMVVMDNQSKKPIRSVNFSPIDNYVVNAENSRMYIVGGAGKVACVEIRSEK